MSKICSALGAGFFSFFWRDPNLQSGILLFSDEIQIFKSGSFYGGGLILSPSSDARSWIQIRVFSVTDRAGQGHRAGNTLSLKPIPKWISIVQKFTGKPRSVNTLIKTADVAVARPLRLVWHGPNRDRSFAVKNIQITLLTTINPNVFLKTSFTDIEISNNCSPQAPKNTVFNEKFHLENVFRPFAPAALPTSLFTQAILIFRACGASHCLIT